MKTTSSTKRAHLFDRYRNTVRYLQENNFNTTGIHTKKHPRYSLSRQVPIRPFNFSQPGLPSPAAVQKLCLGGAQGLLVFVCNTMVEFYTSVHFLGILLPC